MTTSTDAALDLQMELLSWSETGSGKTYTGGLLPYAAKSDEWLDEMPGRRANWEYVSESIHRAILVAGDTFAVSEEIVDVLEFASSTIPDYELHASDLPTRTGFVVFDRPIIVHDSKGKPLVVTALGWTPSSNGPMDVIYHDDDADPYDGATGVMLILWTDPADPRDHFHDEWAKDVRGSRLYSQFKPPRGLFSMLGGMWEFGETPNTDITKILMAFFRFVQEPWVDPRMVTPSRASRRRALRKNVEAKVHVVRLRRKEGGSHGADTVPGGEGVEWSCRWLVRGHWRNQWYPSIKAHRPKWIPEHIKGPEDRPLVIHDTVFQVDR